MFGEHDITFIDYTNTIHIEMHFNENKILLKIAEAMKIAKNYCELFIAAGVI